MNKQWIWFGVATAATVLAFRALMAKRPRARARAEARVDRAGEDSFPASDPPSWTSGTATPRTS